MLQLGRDKSHILNYEAQSHMEVFEFLKFLVCNLKRNHLTVQQLREWNGLVITPDDLCFLNFITVLIYVFLVCISRICCIWALIEMNFFKFKKKHVHTDFMLKSEDKINTWSLFNTPKRRITSIKYIVPPYGFCK